MSTFKSIRQDFFPNYISWTLTEPSADAFVTQRINTPIPRNQVVTGNKAVVMELLWVEIDIHNLQFNAASETTFFSLSTGMAPTVTTNDLSDGNCLAYLSMEMDLLTTGAALHTMPQRYDFQSQDGFGLLLAADAFHCSLLSTSTGVALQAHCRLYYRFVHIPIFEYVGLVQSQQSSN